LAVFFLALVLCCACLPGAAAARERRTLVVVCPEDAPPYGYRNAEGDPAGLLPDLWRLLADRMGLTLDLRLAPGAVPVILDERGEPWSSRELAAKLKAWEDAARTPWFLVGGAFGLSDEVRERARVGGAMFSLGRITLPHELARVVLLEQLYRAASINKGLPYHHD